MKVHFVDSGREPQCPPDPKYPKGIDADLSQGAAVTCIVQLPYPAPRCGLMVVECPRCGLRVAVTVAGRVDDPRSVKLQCKLN
jgi:DNA-directed RNA polymerase subunit RPC12/RpoP